MSGCQGSCGASRRVLLPDRETWYRWLRGVFSSYRHCAHDGRAYRGAVRSSHRKEGFFCALNLSLGPGSPVRAGTRPRARRLSNTQHRVELGSDSQDRQMPVGRERAGKSGGLLKTHTMFWGACMFRTTAQIVMPKCHPSEICT